MTSTDNQPGTITTFGSGSAAATPDRMRVTISIESHASTVALAYANAGRNADAVISSLRGDKVPSRDIATSGLSVRTDTTWADNRERIIGYVASTSLTVTLREIGTPASESGATGPAAVIARAVEAGGDDVRLGGLTLTVSDEESLLSRARDAAFDHALVKAQQYALRANRTLGTVLEITENTSAAPMPTPRIAFAARSEALGAAPAPIELGESELTATIRVTWQLN
ncbi:SIMPL domain-containing protein [Nocardia huaxiensis]|uniref:SIMPL domain-containing protein n=1 Tax=Nocardia huaxiensis TaxID=2755382 RepID=UPI001E2F0C6F|nr:SIMPL domain-containing protein [Nocardia huaxiensis]UFS97160.1 SIMPL domain-containing protein [Nocardia huaxiensis]